MRGSRRPRAESRPGSSSRQSCRTDNRTSGRAYLRGEPYATTTVSRDDDGRNSSALHFDRGDPQSLREAPKRGVDARAVLRLRVKAGDARAAGQINDAGVLHVAQDGAAVDA